MRLGADGRPAPVPPPVKLINDPAAPRQSTRTESLVLAASTSAPACSVVALATFSFTYSVPLFRTSRPVFGRRLLSAISVLSRGNVEPGPTVTACGGCVSGAAAVEEPWPATEGAVKTLTGSIMRPCG